MKWTGFFLGMGFALLMHSEYAESSSPVQVRSSSPRLEFSASYEQTQEPLTTDLLNQIDPTHKNPHLERWGLKRTTELKGLKARPLADGLYSVSAQAVVSRALGYIRPQGPWYQALSQFPCTEQAQGSGFATQEGALQAAAHAAEQWSHLLSQELQTLSSLFSKVKVQSASTAHTRGEMIFQGWLDRLEERWRAEAYPNARAEEWKFYTQEAKSAGICPRTSPVSPLLSLKQRMEPLSGSPPRWNQVLARAPARLWNGLFSIRLSVTLGEKKLNGRFLIDSTAPRSVISPVWLESQGVYPAWLLIPHALPERVIWSGLWPDQRPLSRLIQVDQVEMSGLRLPLSQFLLAETEFFAPPENLGSCCDGVLGLDFLRLYPIEFQSKAPAEVRVWPKKGFLWSGDTPWLELSESAEGGLVSSCQLKASSGEKQGAFTPLPGVRWDTALEASSQVHTPGQPQLRALGQSRSLSLECDSMVLAQGIRPELPQPPIGIQASGPLTQSNPALSVGMDLLRQSVFTLDLPHGRIWFKDTELPLKPAQKNQSGLVLQFQQINGQRVFRVEELKPRSPASVLSQKGLQKGGGLLELNSTPVDELDLWQVEQILSGAQGQHVQLKWKSKKQIKEGVINL